MPHISRIQNYIFIKSSQQAWKLSYLNGVNSEGESKGFLGLFLADFLGLNGLYIMTKTSAKNYHTKNCVAFEALESLIKLAWSHPRFKLKKHSLSQRTASFEEDVCSLMMFRGELFPLLGHPRESPLLKKQ